MYRSAGSKLRNSAKGSTALWLRRNPFEYVNNTTLIVGENNIDNKLDVSTSSLQPSKKIEENVLVVETQADRNLDFEFKDIQPRNKVLQ